jgi:hypothetical protein
MVAVETVRRVDVGLSWRAIFAGVVLGVVTLFLLTLLGVAVGLSSVEVTSTGTNFRSIGLGAGLWTLFTTLVSWFVGAAFASFLSGCLERGTGVVHGLTTWGVGFFLVLSLVGSSIVGVLSSGFGLVGQGAQLFGSSGLARQQEVQQGAKEAGREAQQRLGQLGPEDARQATSAAAKGAWGAFFTAALSLGAASAGGAYGTRRLQRRYEKPGRPIVERPVVPVMTPRTT